MFSTVHGLSNRPGTLLNYLLSSLLLHEFVIRETFHRHYMILWWDKAKNWMAFIRRLAAQKYVYLFIRFEKRQV